MAAQDLQGLADQLPLFANLPASTAALEIMQVLRQIQAAQQEEREHQQHMQMKMVRQFAELHGRLDELQEQMQMQFRRAEESREEAADETKPSAVKRLENVQIELAELKTLLPYRLHNFNRRGDQNLLPVPRVVDGAIPDAFPATQNDLEHLSESRIDYFLLFYQTNTDLGKPKPFKLGALAGYIGATVPGVQA